VEVVPGSARTGLIFTRSQEGTQSDPYWPNKWGIRYHVTSCGVLRVGARQGEANHGSVALGIRQWELLCAFRCLCCIFFLSLLLLLLLTSFAVLPLSQPFCLFLSILPPTPVGEGAIERLCGPLLPAGAKSQGKQEQ